MTEKSSILVIASMHRSGSSLVASLLQSASLHIGRKVMLYPDEGNLKGYFESFDFWHFHRSVLQSQGIDENGWTLQEKIEVEDRFVEEAKKIVSQNSLSVTWGWKEPRTTLFLEFWAELLPEANFLLIYRSPWEVIDSLYRRHDALFQSQPELAVKIWLHYNKKILNFHNRNSSRCLLVNLSTIIKNKELYIQAINQKFNTNLTAPASTLYDPSLLHTQGVDSYRPTLIEHYFPEAVEMYQELDARAWQPQETPDLSWREQIKPSLYRFWAFQDWVNVRKLERQNKALQSELQQCQSQVHQTQEELDKINPQLHQMEEVLEQSQSQLQQTEGLLEQSQSQFYKTQIELEQSQSQLQHSYREIEQAKCQVDETETLLKQSQSQLEQTESSLEICRSQLLETRAELEISQGQHHETLRKFKRSQSQHHKIQEELEQSQSQHHQTEALLQEYQSLVHQTQQELEQSQSQHHQTEALLEEYQSRIQHLQIDLQSKVSQLSNTQRQLEESYNKIHQIQSQIERLEFQQAIAINTNGDSKSQYGILVWDAWYAYHNGAMNKMQDSLKQSLKCSPFSPTDTVINWLESFTKFSGDKGDNLDTLGLTNLAEWKQLMRLVTSVKALAVKS